MPRQSLSGKLSPLGPSMPVVQSSFGSVLLLDAWTPGMASEED